MPTKTIKYTCDFKCGHSAFHLFKKAQEHEIKCWKNPINKTCSTCKNEIYFYDEIDEHTGCWCRDCKLNEMSAFIEEIHENLKIKSGSHHIKPLWNCPNHNLDNVIDETLPYINDVRIKIENAVTRTDNEIDWF